MALATVTIDVPPEAVFAVLADGHRYAEWVVGAKRVRSVDESWPRPGSRFHHVVGFGPVEVRDYSEVLEVDAGRRLVLRVRARPAGDARVEIDLVPVDRGTEVRMAEHPTRGVARLVHNPVFDVVLKVRNREALRRLRRQIEGARPA